MSDIAYHGALKGVPRVRVLDGNGSEVCRGYYFAIPRTTYAFKQDYDAHIASGDRMILDGVVTHEMSDWGLPNRIRVFEVTPPHRIELLADGED